MSINLSDFSARELDALIAKAKQRKTVLKKRKPIAAVRKKIAAMAQAEGYDVTELFGAGRGRSATTAAATPRAAAKKGRTLGKVAPKYRNPANPAETWTGRGKQPRWLAAQIGQGRKVEDFLIEGAGGGSARKTAAKASRKRAGKAAAKRGRKATRKTATRAAARKTAKAPRKRAAKKS